MSTTTNRIPGDTPFSRIAELRSIAVIALPIILAQLLQMGMGVIDTVMAGRIDALSIAAIALGSSLWFFVALLGIGVMLALSPIIAQHIGANNHPLIREELRQGIWLALTVGIFQVIIVLSLVYVMPLIGVEDEIIPAATDYIHWVAWSLPFNCLYLVPRSFNEANGNTMPILWIQVIILPVNILGNYLLMYGNFGFPQMGASGAALSTGIAQVLGCVMLYTYTLRATRYEDYNLRKRMTGPDWKHIYQTFKLGFPIAISMGMEVGLFTATALLMGRFGVVAAAGHQIALNIASIAFMIPLGVSMALTVRIGQAAGAGNRLTARKRGQLGIVLCGAICTASALVLWLFGEMLAGLYTDEVEVVSIASKLLILAALFQIVDGLQIGAVGVLRGLKDTKVPMLIAIFCYWVVGMGTALNFGIAQNMGPAGLWMGLVAGLAIAAIALNIRFYLLTHSATDTPAVSA